jgi:Core-2/I-Branching enzyme
MARVVYLIATHVNPEQIIRLVRTLHAGSPTSRVVLHHDYDSCYLDADAFSGLERVHLTDHVPIQWGKFSQVEMTLRSIQWALDRYEFDWLVFLSGQDYPIQPLSAIEDFLDRTTYDGFLQATPVEDLPWGIGRGRYLFRYYRALWLPRVPGMRKPLERRKSKFERRLEPPRLNLYLGRRRLRIGVRPRSSPFDGAFHCYAGSSWWTLSRRCVEYVCRFTQENPRLSKHYRRTLVASDESFFATVLLNNDSLDICSDDNLRFISWTVSDLARRGHPDLLTAGDYERIIGSRKQFARKFDQAKDSRILDLLDAHIAAGARSG